MDKFNLDKLNEVAKPRPEESINKAQQRKTKARVKALTTKLRSIGKQGSTERERYVELDIAERDDGRLYCQLVYFGAADERPLAVYWLDETMESGDFIAFADLSDEWQRTIANQVYVM